MWIFKKHNQQKKYISKCMWRHQHWNYHLSSFRRFRKKFAVGLPLLLEDVHTNPAMSCQGVGAEPRSRGSWSPVGVRESPSLHEKNRPSCHGISMDFYVSLEFNYHGIQKPLKSQTPRKKTIFPPKSRTFGNQLFPRLCQILYTNIPSKSFQHPG